MRVTLEVFGKVRAVAGSRRGVESSSLKKMEKYIRWSTESSPNAKRYKHDVLANDSHEDFSMRKVCWGF